MGTLAMRFGATLACIAVCAVAVVPRRATDAIRIGEIATVFGGQSGPCYVSAPDQCPISTDPPKCGDCDQGTLTCDEDGNMVTYTVLYCSDDGGYHFQSSDASYDTAYDMGQEAVDGHTAQKDSTVDCGDVYYCTTSNSTCDDLTSGCAQDNYGFMVCKTLSTAEMNYNISIVNFSSPSCPQPVSSIGPSVPDALLAAAWHNGLFYQLGR